MEAVLYDGGVWVIEVIEWLINCGGCIRDRERHWHKLVDIGNGKLGYVDSDLSSIWQR